MVARLGDKLGPFRLWLSAVQMSDDSVGTSVGPRSKYSVGLH